MSIFEADSREHMDALLADYPGIKEGFVTVDVRMIEPSAKAPCTSTTVPIATMLLLFFSLNAPGLPTWELPQ
jgi:hypothetical protein